MISGEGEECSIYMEELTSGMTDRRWPHQVALRADQVSGENYKVTRDFCRDLSVAPRGHTVRRDGKDYIIFCLLDPIHADLFRERFGGERFDPKDRGRGSKWHEWRNRP
jgi:hypothetical protein